MERTQRPRDAGRLRLSIRSQMSRMQVWKTSGCAGIRALCWRRSAGGSSAGNGAAPSRSSVGETSCFASLDVGATLVGSVGAVSRPDIAQHAAFGSAQQRWHSGAPLTVAQVSSDRTGAAARPKQRAMRKSTRVNICAGLSGGGLDASIARNARRRVRRGCIRGAHASRVPVAASRRDELSAVIQICKSSDLERPPCFSLADGSRRAMGSGSPRWRGCHRPHAGRVRSPGTATGARTESLRCAPTRARSGADTIRGRLRLRDRPG